MRYRYVKRSIRTERTPPAKKKRKISRLLALAIFGIGCVCIISAIFPIIQYQLAVSPALSGLISPISTAKVLGEESTTKVDYTQASSWFENVPKLPPLPSKITYYTISIPKLKISDALVEIGGEDLKKSLIHYAGTALPGQYGNTIIFGHSSLPQFFGPKNYLAIFATLPTLKTNDIIFVNFDGIMYKYKVEKMVEVEPDDISILEQRFDDSYLSLVTCVPPGTYLRRLVIRARLADI
jgi:sortase A